MGLYRAVTKSSFLLLTCNFYFQGQLIVHNDCLSFSHTCTSQAAGKRGQKKKIKGVTPAVFQLAFPVADVVISFILFFNFYFSIVLVLIQFYLISSHLVTQSCKGGWKM